MAVFVMARRVCLIGLSVSVVGIVFFETIIDLHVTAAHLAWRITIVNICFWITLLALIVGLIGGAFWAWKWPPAWPLGLGVSLVLGYVLTVRMFDVLGLNLFLIYGLFACGAGGVVLFFVGVIRLVLSWRQPHS
jgi:hypothetical protein